MFYNGIQYVLLSSHLSCGAADITVGYGAPAGRWEDITERCYGSTLIRKTHVAFILAETHAVYYIFQQV